MDAGTSVITQTILLIIVVVFTAIYFFFKKNYNYWKNRGIHYEEPFLIFGNLSYVMRKSSWQMFKDWGKRNSSDYYGIFLGWKPALIIQSPEYAKMILVKDHHHFLDRYLYSSYDSDPLGSLNVFSVKSPLWKNIRQELTPMFTSNRLKVLTELMNVNAKHLVNKIQRDYIDKREPVNLKELFSMYASDTVGYTVFGIHVSALNDPSSPLWYITKHMVKWTFSRGFEFTMIFFLPFIARTLRLTLFSQPATEYVQKLFWGTVKERQSNGKTSDKDLVNHLLRLKEDLKLPAEAGSQLAEDMMLAQAAVFIFGSVETSSTTLSYCLQELAHHPEEQEKLYEEIDKKVKESGNDVLNYTDLMELKYLSACILETLRKYPPVPHIDRACHTDYQLNNDVLIEKGTPVFVNVVHIHYNEEYYPEPEKWRPERMLNMADNDNRDFTFLPFGEGPRFCIGKRYGLMQIRAAMVQMVQKYKFEPAVGEPYQIDSDPYSVLLSPKSGGRVTFVPRSNEKNV
uniref:unspecific monooxygenase n=2 Tax=Manduca sexta TaxID=7130 RepID=D5L0N3_MANSE|nr:cytochrome P450 332A5 [Manduca sexta]